MYAIVRVGGRQYRAEVGQAIVVEKLLAEVGETLDLGEVLLVSDGTKTTVGQPLVEGASVKAEVVDQFKGKKIVIYKYKPKERYRRKAGHRQQYTRLMINDIAAGAKKSRARKAKAEESTEGENAE